MKITDIRVYNLRYPLEEPFANSIAWNTARTAGVIEVITDAGVTGWGEGVADLNEAALRARLLGRDPFDIEVIWNDLHLRGGVGFSELSAVDIALWDISGQSPRAARVPAPGRRVPGTHSGIRQRTVLPAEGRCGPVVDRRGGVPTRIWGSRP